MPTDVLRVIANCAASLDGAMGRAGPRPLKLSSKADWSRVHRLRASVDAVMVGIGTVRADDPRLTVKKNLARRAGTNPLRVVVAGRRKPPKRSLVLNDEAPSLVYHTGRPTDDVRYVRVAADGAGRPRLRRVLHDLSRRGIRTLLVEGGPRLLASLLREDLVNELTVFVSPRFLTERSAPRLRLGGVPASSRLRFSRTSRAQGGALLVFKNS